MSEITQNNLEGVGQPSPLSMGVNALENAENMKSLLKFFQYADAVFTQTELRNNWGQIPVRIGWSDIVHMFSTNDDMIYGEYFNDWGVSFWVHDEEKERIYYLLYWTLVQEEQIYYVRILGRERKHVRHKKGE